MRTTAQRNTKSIYRPLLPRTDPEQVYLQQWRLQTFQGLSFQRVAVLMFHSFLSIYVK